MLVSTQHDDEMQGCVMGIATVRVKERRGRKCGDDEAAEMRLRLRCSVYSCLWFAGV